MKAFQFNTTPGIRFGSDYSVSTAEEVSKKLGNKILFVTDPGLVKIGLHEKTITELQKYSEILIFDNVEADPSIKTLMNCVQQGRDFDATGVIGFGGGSSMDVSKLTALLIGSDENIHEAWGVANAKGPRLPLALYPTTSGTGSEVTPISIITQEDLEKKGAIFVNELFECPKDRPVVFSAHGVAKSVFSEAEERNLQYIDATCPLVTKVHIEAKRYHKLGYQIIMIGHKNHPETIGTMGQLPNGEVLLVENCKDVDVINPRDENKLAYVTQTTLSIDDTLEIGNALKNRFPGIVAPHKEDICYATTNRQNAVKKISPLIDGLLVVGSINSSNSKRLVEVGKNAGCRYSQLIDNVNDIDWRSISGSESIGLTAGASAPEILINQVIEEFKKRFKATIEFIEITKEDIQFKIPNSIRN